MFQVDLFSARGALPRAMQDVMARHKDIMYSSRTRQETDNYARLQRSGRRACYKALSQVPEDELTDEERQIMRQAIGNLPGSTSCN